MAPRQATCHVCSGFGFCRAFGLGFRLGSFGLDCGFHGACRALGSVNEGLGFTCGLILGASSKVEPLGTLLGYMANTKEFRGLFKKDKRVIDEYCAARIYPVSKVNGPSSWIQCNFRKNRGQ